VIYPREYGGTRPDDFDAFYELILCDEFSRVGGGSVLGQMAINSMALPPILNSDNQYLKDKVCRDVITGRKNICLAISEPWAGSDVANIKTSAVKVGDHYVVNGQKKWITGGTYGDFFTVAVRTGGEGMGGISLLLVERDSPGLSVRKMETQVRARGSCVFAYHCNVVWLQFDTAHSTTVVTFEDVKVPVRHLIGEENLGFMLILLNFNHEVGVIDSPRSVVL
jgi:alkylation response protein AidB-like acyl-CoA dehydrogenase